VNLVLLEAHELDASGAVTLDDGRAAHMLDVLKVSPGQTVRAGVVDGPAGLATVTAIAGRRVSMQCTLDGRIAGRQPVDLLLALPRPKVLRRLWAQLAALGVGRIILTNAARVERPYFDTHVIEPAGYRPLLIEGLQQARDTRLPDVSIHRQFRILIEDHLDTLSPDCLRMVAEPSAPAGMREVMSGRAGRRVLMAVGPEGGWNDFELSLLERHGFQRVGIGPRPLRVDTACLALLGIVHDALRSE
jgi:RsmE family RNA methyltransferase